jgi:hypothetical protein
MRSLTVRVLAAALLCGATALTASAQQSPAAEKIAKLRAGLNQKMTLDFSGSLEDALEHLRQKTKLPVTVDQYSLQMRGLGMNPNGFPNPNGGQQANVNLKVDNGPVRVGLQRLLAQHGLTYILLNDSVHVIADQFAFNRQMQQRVAVDVSGKPLAAALKDLVDETGITLLIEPRLAKVAEEKVTLQLEDATLETALRLLTEVGGLKAVQVGNVVFITDAKKAEQIRKENMDNQRPNHVPPPFVYHTPVFGGRVGGGVVVPGNVGQAVPPAPPAKTLPPQP